MATLPYWNNDEVISSNKLNSMVQAIINGDPLAVKVSNATKNDVNQIVDYLSNLHNSAKTNLNSATYTSDFDTTYTNMTALVSNKLGSYANDDTVDLYSTGIRASIIAFLQAYDTMMSNDRLNNKNTDNTLNGRIDSEAQTRANDDNAINTKISDMQANGGGRNLIANTGTDIVVDDTSNTGTSGYQFFSLDLTEQLKKGDTITVSAEGTVTGTGDISTYSVLLYDFTKSVEISNKIQLKSGQRDYAQITVNQWVNGNTNQLIIYAGKQGDTQGKKSIIHHLMVEKGTVAHDWQPAPEDVDSDIKSVEAKAEANTASISKITSNGGGVNLLLGTRDFSGDNWLNLTNNSSTGWMITSDTYNGFSVVETAQDWSGIAQYYPVKTGETYTFSLFARYTSGTGSSCIYVILNNNSENGFTQAWVDNTQGGYSLDTNWKKCRITFTAITDGYIKPRMERTDTNTNVMQVCGFMLEKGTVAHDWSPNPDDVQSQLDNLNANKLSSADANWNLVANNSNNSYNYASGSKITLPNGSSITVKDDRIIPHINLPRYLTDYTNNNDLNAIATSCGECDNLFIPSSTVASLNNLPTNPDTNKALTGDCFYTYHYAYSGTTVRAFQKIYSCDYNYVFIRSYNSSSSSWSNWSCLTPYA